MKTIEIKSIFESSVIFSHQCENNTTKTTVEAAVRSGASLEGAYLRGAYLEGASLYRADLRGANLEGADIEKEATNN